MWSAGPYTKIARRALKSCSCPGPTHWESAFPDGSCSLDLPWLPRKIFSQTQILPGSGMSLATFQVNFMVLNGSFLSKCILWKHVSVLEEYVWPVSVHEEAITSCQSYLTPAVDSTLSHLFLCYFLSSPDFIIHYTMAKVMHQGLPLYELPRTLVQGRQPEGSQTV